MKGHFNTFKVYLKQIKDVKMFNVIKCSKIHPKSVLKAVFQFLKNLNKMFGYHKFTFMQFYIEV